jgi:beta-galactosidase/beta-glucuronidase
MLTLLVGSGTGVSAERFYLSGTGPENAKLWDFKVSEGRKSGEWHRIPVPSNWEQEGFGAYDYGHIEPEEKNDEVGLYRTRFTVPERYSEGYFVRLVFEGSMTMTTVRINGKQIGEPNQGGYNRFRYPLTHIVWKGGPPNHIEFGEENLLEVEVAKRPANKSLDLAERKADFWVFGGIYRPVYLEVLPLEFIDRVAIDAKHTGALKVDVFTQMHGAYRKVMASWVDELRVQVETLDGEPVGQPTSRKIWKNAGVVSAEMRLAGIARILGHDDKLRTLITLQKQLRHIEQGERDLPGQ